MKATELREKSTPELTDLLGTLQDRKFRLRLQHYMGQLEQVTSLKTTRRDIARVKTILRERAGE